MAIPAIVVVFLVCVVLPVTALVAGIATDTGWLIVVGLFAVAAGIVTAVKAIGGIRFT